MKIKLAPSLLAADFGDLRGELRAVADLADYIHIDVMDGHFVPNITIGPPVVNALKEGCKTPFDIHLMISEPLKYAERFHVEEEDIITFHLEAVEDPWPLIAEIRRLGARVGVALKPCTPAEALAEILPEIDLALVMTVEPGFGGQQLIRSMLGKVRRLRELVEELDAGVQIEVDGGINEENIHEVVAAGAEIIVAGTAIFGQPDPREAIAQLRRAALEPAPGGLEA